MGAEKPPARERGRIADRTIESLHELYPNADCALNYSTAHEIGRAHV